MEIKIKKILRITAVTVVIITVAGIFYSNPDLLGGALKNLKKIQTQKITKSTAKKGQKAGKTTAVVKPSAPEIIYGLTAPAPIPATQQTTAAVSEHDQILYRLQQLLDKADQTLLAVKNMPPTQIVYQQVLPATQPSQEQPATQAAAETPAPTPQSPAPPAPEPSSTPQSPAPPQLPESVIGYWSFDNIEGLAAKDGSGNKNDGTIIGNPKAVEGKIGKALDFDGVKDYVAIPLFTTAVENTTIEAWVNPKTAPQRGHFLYIGQYASNGYGLEISNGCAEGNLISAISHRVACDLIGAAEILQINQWTHIVLTRGSAEWSLYINGELKKIGGAGIPFTPTQNITIGASAVTYMGETFSPFRGIVDEVKIYNKSLTAEEIKAAYNLAQPNAAADPTLLGYYTFESIKDGTTIEDNSGNNNHGIIDGAPNIVDGKTGKALNFNGADAVKLDIEVSQKNGEQNTVAFWMYWEGNAHVMPFGFNTYDLYFDPNYNFGFNTSAGDLFGIDGTNLSNKWVHVAAVFNNGSAKLSKLYLNGIEHVLEQKEGGNTGNASATSNVTIGGWGVTPTIRFKGAIDEFRIYNRALSSEEIAKLSASN